MTLNAHDLVLSYGGPAVVDGLSLQIAQGRITVLVGANASGKSTLLRALGRLLRPQSGDVLLDGESIASLPTREVARRLAILPQGPVAPEALTVRQLVSQGRYTHQRLLRRWSPEDEAALTGALEATSTSGLANRPVDELSGGQRQRAWIAMALAQQTDLLLLDEPTTYLDLAHQVSILELVAQLNARDERTIVMVLHDLNQAARYADQIVALRAGAIVAAGPPAEIMTEAMVRTVFDLDVRIIEDPITGGPLCIPASTCRTPVLERADRGSGEQLPDLAGARSAAMPMSPPTA